MEGVDPELLKLEAWDTQLAAKLVEAGIKKRDDLATWRWMSSPS